VLQHTLIETTGPNVEIVEMLQNMQKEIRPLIAKVTKKQFVDAYLKLWNGGFKMTDKEMDIVKDILSIYETVSKDGIKEPYLSEIVFSQKHIAQLKTKHELTKQGWSNYKKALLAKKILFEKDEIVYINPVLIPRTEITFKFIINEPE
jgi:hypothetical protein